MWSEILIVVCCLSAIFIFLFKSASAYLHVRLLFVFSLLSIIAGMLPSIGVYSYEGLEEWSMICAISFVITALTVVIREILPAYARYPFIFSLLPLLIIALYPFITDAQVLKDLLNQILQGGALLVSIIFYITLIDKLKRNWILLLGIIGLLFSYLIFWFSGELLITSPWLWQVCLAISVVLISYKMVNVIEIIRYQ